MSQHLTFLSPRDFVERGSGALAVTRAPDGLPLLVMIPKPPSVLDLLAALAGDLGMHIGPKGFDETPMEALADQVEHLRKTQRITSLSRGDQRLNVMILGVSARQVSGATLLERLLGPKSPAELSDDSPPPLGQYASSREEHTGLIALSKLDAEQVVAARAAYQAGQIYVGLTIADSQPVLVRLERDASGWPHYSYRAPFQSETIECFEGSLYETYPRYSHQTPQEPLRLRAQEQTEYVRQRLSNPQYTWQWRAPRQGIAKVLYDLVGNLAARHDRGEIHGDLKPSNVLATAQGTLPIDGLSLAVGDRSPAITRGWASPEQVMAKPVSVQTDHYPIGLMLLRLVGGVLYGIEARVSVPTGGTTLARHTLLQDPAVYIDPTTTPVAGEHLEAWRTLIERCVRFEPEERYPSTEALLDAMRPLVERDTLRGEVLVGLSFGQQVFGAREGDPPTSCWLAS